MKTQILGQAVPSIASNDIDLGCAFETLRVANPLGRNSLILRTNGCDELSQHVGPDQGLYGIMMPEEHLLVALNAGRRSEILLRITSIGSRSAQFEGHLFLFSYPDGDILVYEFAWRLIESSREVTFSYVRRPTRPGSPHPRSPFERMRDHLTILGSLPSAARWPNVRRRIEKVLINNKKTVPTAPLLVSQFYLRLQPDCNPRQDSRSLLAD